MVSSKEKSDQFLEYTILTIFLWIGIWGIVTMFLEHYIESFGAKLATYIVFAISAFSLLHTRNHI